MSKDRILIISYLFPPVGGIAVQRALSLAKYLPQNGYEVHVLKAANAGGPVYDPNLARQIPPSVNVHQAFTPDLPFALRQKLWSRLSGKKAKPQETDSKETRPQKGMSAKSMVRGVIQRILCPEPEILWAPFALRKARQIIRRYDIGSVLVTVPPFSALVVGSALKRQFPRLKVISDFRDEWLSFYLKDFDFQSGDFTRRRAEQIERQAVECSDLVAAVNHSSRDEIRNRYPGQPDSKFVVVPNGYDPEAFAGFVPRAHQFPRMMVTHVGTVYKTASPRFYLDALDGLPEESRRLIETRFAGRISDTERTLLEGRKSTVNILGFMPQSEALKFLEDTDYLLLTMTNAISVPGKIFEYMAARKPILAVTPPGSEVDRILRETSCGISAPPDDASAIQAMLMRALDAWQKGTGIVKADDEQVRRYERPQLAREYGKLIRGLPEPGTPS